MQAFIRSKNGKLTYFVSLPVDLRDELLKYFDITLNINNWQECESLIYATVKIGTSHLIQLTWDLCDGKVEGFLHPTSHGSIFTRLPGYRDTMSLIYENYQMIFELEDRFIFVEKRFFKSQLDMISSMIVRMKLEKFAIDQEHDEIKEWY